MIQATLARANAVLALLNSKDVMPDRPAQPHPSSPTTAITMPRVYAHIDGAAADTRAAVLASAAASPLRSSVATGDWDDMFSAVTARLGLIVTAPPASTSASPPADEAIRIRLAVLECVAALEQLHATLKNELGRCPQTPNGTT